MAGSFFDRPTATARPPHPFDRRVGQAGRQFALAAPNRVLVQAGDLRQPLEPAPAEPRGLQRDIPAPLLLLQPANQEVDLLMQLPLRVLDALLTGRTLTLTDLDRYHQPLPSDSRLRVASSYIRPRSLTSGSRQKPEVNS